MKRYPNAHTVMEHFELRSERVAYNDRIFMKNRLHAPIEYDKTNSGWYYENPNYFLPSIFLTKKEVTAFFLGEEILKRYMGTTFEQPIRNALNKIMQYLPEYVAYDIQSEASSIAFTGGATVDVDPSLLLELNQAIQSKYQMEILYYSASQGKTSTRVVDPYYLHNIRGDWYLIAYCHNREAVRDFLAGRVRKWKLLPSTFNISRNFSLDKYLQTGFMAERAEEPVDIVIKFDEYQARWIRERQWHPSQKIKELESGGLILRLKVGGLKEVKRWIMGYGSHAEVLEPEELRLQFREEAEKMRKIYEKNGE
ncbi:WYL domain-containing protein [Candidatus Poribacteria bacterium]|nr:WYL domain-containing protein [Candidatus Poribacteria bacterium]